MRVTCLHSRAGRVAYPKAKFELGSNLLEPLFISIVSSASRQPSALLQEECRQFRSLQWNSSSPTTPTALCLAPGRMQTVLIPYVELQLTNHAHICLSLPVVAAPHTPHSPVSRTRFRHAPARFSLILLVSLLTPPLQYSAPKAGLLFSRACVPPIHSRPSL